MRAWGERQGVLLEQEKGPRKVRQIGEREGELKLT